MKRSKNTPKEETECPGSEKLVFKIKKLGTPGAGLHVDGRPTNDPKDLAKFRKAFKQKKVIVRRIPPEPGVAS